MASPDIFTASRDLTRGIDTLDTAAYAVLHGGRADLPGKYSAYTYTEALFGGVRQHGNLVLAMQQVYEKGYPNFRNPVEAGIACFQTLKKRGLETAKNQAGDKKKPLDSSGPLIPLEHGAFFGEKNKVDSAINAWNDRDSRPTVRLIYDRKLGDPGSIRFSDIKNKLSEDSRVDVKLVPIDTPEDLIAALCEAQSHTGKSLVVNVVGVHGDLDEPEKPGAAGEPEKAAESGKPGEPGAHLFVGGWEKENKVNTEQVLAATKDTMTCFISCYGSKVFEPPKNGKSKTPAGKEATATLPSPKSPSAAKS